MSKIILVSIYNYGCIDLALNFLESLKRVNLADKHVSYVTDEKSFEVLKEKGYNVELFNEFGITEEKMDFEQKDFVKLCYIRYAIFHKLLHTYDYVWCLDVDTVVLGDIISYFLNSSYVDCDITYQLDMDSFCGGCFVLKSNSKTKSFVKQIFEARDNKINEQRYIMRIFMLLGNSNPLKIGAFGLYSFINGGIYFGDGFQEHKQYLKKSTDPVYFVHANYMVGIDTKIKAMKEKGLWFLKDE
jgi:hypothetical protein